jgi:hypothetical protein
MQDFDALTLFSEIANVKERWKLRLFFCPNVANFGALPIKIRAASSTYMPKVDTAAVELLQKRWYILVTGHRQTRVTALLGCGI